MYDIYFYEYHTKSKMKKMLFVIIIVIIIIGVDFYLKRDTTTVINLDKTYAAQATDCSPDVIDFFEFKDNKCTVKIEGVVKVFKNNSRYEFKGSIFINNKKYTFDDSNVFVSTKVQLDGKDVFMGLNDSYSSTYKSDVVIEYNFNITHDANYDLEQIHFIVSSSVVGTLNFE